MFIKKNLPLGKISLMIEAYIKKQSFTNIKKVKNILIVHKHATTKI